MKSVVSIVVLLLAGCGGDRVRTNYTPPKPEPQPAREHPQWNPQPKPEEIPYSGTELEDVTTAAADELWHPAWKIIEPLSPTQFEVDQPTNPVRMNQRFEVWRGDRFLGMAIVESAGKTRARLRLDRPEEDDGELAAGDQVLSRLWMPTRKLHVALHGTFEPPNESMGRDALTAQLEFAGSVVDEKVGPETDLVIIGSNLLGDSWYRKARNDLRFETMKDEDAAMYFQPAK
ncbi:MAG: hypothetical protein H6839_12595 [Planctomycetes bacterium]|nr:hypothetical protein [Planctomycetota bacterium]